MSARRDLRSSAQQLPVRTSEQLKVALRKSECAADGEDALRNPERDGNGLSNSERIAAELLDDAFDLARLRNQEIAHLCGVSESMVIKWRSTTSHGCPSFVQMLLLPPAFHYALHKAMNKRFGYGRQALRDVMDALGSLAMVVD